LWRLQEVKKTRGKPKAELKRMEHELRAKQQTELHALDRQLAAQRPKPVPKPLSPKAESDDDESSSEETTPREEVRQPATVVIGRENANSPGHTDPHAERGCNAIRPTEGT
jgi:hypothetical protein